jgi:hypothetical protein
MKRQLVFVAVTVALLLVGSHAQGAPREGGGNAAARKPERNESNSVAGARAHEPRGGQAPGGAWSERSHHAGQTAGPGAHGAAASPGGSNAAKLKQKSTSSGTAGSSGQAATKRGSSSGTAEKAAGAAAVKRNSPQGAGATNGAPGVDTSTTSASQASANRNHDHAAGAAAVRHAYNNHGLYGQGWFGAHPGAWAPVGIAAGALWAPTTYGAVAG